MKMDTLKKKSAWCTPSFDDIPKKIATSKELSNQTDSYIVSEKINTFQFVDDPKQNKKVNNVSDLLQYCMPRKSAELAISKQKQKEICNWFQRMVKIGQPFVLLVSGPSGCGKTVAIKLIAQENGFLTKEWTNPMDQLATEDNRILKQHERFEEFIIRATRYQSVLGNNSRSVLVVKDFPNIYYEKSENFHELLEQYFNLGREPVIFICTDHNNTRLMTTLFNPEVKQKYGITHISINSVTQASMKTMLKRVANTLNLKSSDMLKVTDREVDETISNNIGDVRSAILNLIFISLKVTHKKIKNECENREETLSILHGVGRVTNPKREQEGNSTAFTHDPKDISVFFETLPTVFIDFLQENYLNTIRDIRDASECASILSTGEILLSEWRDNNIGKVALLYCIQGLMLNNRKPVTGWNPVRKPQSRQGAIQRDVSAAEIRMYESLIKPQDPKVLDLDVGEISD